MKIEKQEMIYALMGCGRRRGRGREWANVTLTFMGMEDALEEVHEDAGDRERCGGAPRG